MVERWTRDAQGFVTWPDGEWVRYSDYAALEAENERLRKALEPFANIEPSTAVAHDGSEAEPYCVYLACRDRFDFTGADLAAARRALEGGE